MYLFIYYILAFIVTSEARQEIFSERERENDKQKDPQSDLNQGRFSYLAYDVIFWLQGYCKIGLF